MNRRKANLSVWLNLSGLMLSYIFILAVLAR
jgi:hypothetical protein